MPHAPDHPAGESLLDYTIRKAQEAGGGGAVIDENDPNVYIYTDTNGDVVAVNRATGQEVWRVSKSEKEAGGAAKPQGAVSKAQLEEAGATFYPGGARLPDGSVYRVNTDGTYDLTKEGGAAQPAAIRSEAVSRIAGQKPSGQIQAPAPGAQAPAGQTPISIAQFLSAADQPGVQAGELLGEIPSGQLGTTPSGETIPDLPITAGGILAPQGIPAGLTPFESSLGTPSPLFTGAVGGTSLGTSFNPEGLASSGGQMPSATVDPSAQALQVLRERARLLADPRTAAMAGELKTTPEAAAQRILDYTTNPAFYFMNQGNPQTNPEPYFDAAQGRWMQPTPGGAIAAPATSSNRATRSGQGDVRVTPIGKGGMELAEAAPLQAAADFFNSIPVAERPAFVASRGFDPWATSTPVTAPSLPPAGASTFGAGIVPGATGPARPNQFGSITLDQPTTALVTQPTSFTAGGAGPEVVQASGPLGQSPAQMIGAGGMQMPPMTQFARLMESLFSARRGRGRNPPLQPAGLSMV